MVPRLLDSTHQQQLHTKTKKQNQKKFGDLHRFVHHSRGPMRAKNKTKPATSRANHFITGTALYCPRAERPELRLMTTFSVKYTELSVCVAVNASGQTRAELGNSAPGLGCVKSHLLRLGWQGSVTRCHIMQAQLCSPDILLLPSPAARPPSPPVGRSARLFLPKPSIPLE